MDTIPHPRPEESPLSACSIALWSLSRAEQAKLVTLGADHSLNTEVMGELTSLATEEFQRATKHLVLLRSHVKWPRADGPDTLSL